MVMMRQSKYTTVCYRGVTLSPPVFLEREKSWHRAGSKAVAMLQIHRFGETDRCWGWWGTQKSTFADGRLPRTRVACRSAADCRRGEDGRGESGLEAHKKKKVVRFRSPIKDGDPPLGDAESSSSLLPKKTYRKMRLPGGLTLRLFYAGLFTVAVGLLWTLITGWHIWRTLSLVFFVGAVPVIYVVSALSVNGVSLSPIECRCSVCVPKSDRSPSPMSRSGIT